MRFAQPIQGEGQSGPAGPPRPELFNLDFDPAEQYNVYERHRDLGDSLMNKMRAFAQELKAQFHESKAER
jgi:hypothetical protein